MTLLHDDPTILRPEHGPLAYVSVARDDRQGTAVAVVLHVDDLLGERGLTTYLEPEWARLIAAALFKAADRLDAQPPCEPTPQPAVRRDAECRPFGL